MVTPSAFLDVKPAIYAMPVAHNTMATNTALIILPLPVVVNYKQFERFCKVAVAQQLAFDRPYQTNALRGANRTLLIPKLMQLLKQ